MTERRTLGDLDFARELDDLDDDDGWYGRTLSADPVAAPDTDDTDRWSIPADVAESVSAPASMPDVEDTPRDDPRVIRRDDPAESSWTGVLAPRNGRGGVEPTESWQSRLSNSGAWDFKVAAAAPWYRSGRVVMAAIAVALTAVAVTGLLLLLRGPAEGDEESPPVSPTNPTSAGPAPTSPAPALSTAIAEPPPPPPPPVSAEEVVEPVAPRPYVPPRQSAPSQSDMPEMGVTRTPVTRAPMSATPPPPRTPDRNSSTPGDAPKRDGGWGPF